MRVVLALVVLGACGFDVPPTGGGIGPGSDASPAHDASADGAGATTTDGATTTADAAPMTPDASTCPADYVAIPAAGTGHFYKVHAKTDQASAISVCALEGGHLLHLDTQDEADALVNAIDMATGGGDTGLYRVVGARDRLPDPDVWHDLDLFTLLSFLPWGMNEPTGLLGEDCILLKHEAAHGVIGADQCLTQHEYACECE